MSDQPSAWAVGWASFAAFMLLLIGSFQALAGIAALVNDDQFVVTEDYVFSLDLTQWGWIHLILGVVLFLSGLGIFSGNVAARTVGVVVAALSAITAFVWLPIQPVWSSILIAVAVAVIWALTTHGRDIATDV